MHLDAKFNLTQGSILKKLVTMAMPIMATSFFQMAFNLADMFWLGRLGSDAVAAAGTAGLFFWLSMALIFIGRMGAQIGVSQNMGKGDPKAAKGFAQNSFAVSLVLGVAFTTVILIFPNQLLGFFDLEADVALQARQYLVTTAFALPFIFAHQVISGAFIGFGNTKIPFYINSLGLAVNIAITPLFIFTFDMGIVGAGIATVIASALNLTLKVYAMKWYKKRPFPDYRILAKPDGASVRQIFKWGAPIGIESALFTMLFMIVTRLVSDFGTGALAAQRVGSQVESLAWMMAGGFSSAITAFMGQNFGAKKYGRMRKAYKLSLMVMGSYGAFIGIVLFVFAAPLVGIFLEDPDYIVFGVEYLRVFAFTQLLFCMEEVAAGSFRGRGLTYKPTVVSITCNILRVAMAYIMVFVFDFGLIGIWIGIAISVTIRSSWMIIWYKINQAKSLPKHDEDTALTPQ